MDKNRYIWSPKNSMKMLRPEEAQHIISEEIRGINFPGSPADLYNPVRYILSNGGKRIRPVLALLSANMFTDDTSPAISPAIGIEIFHNFTLLHDDLMDNAVIRRGNQTVHVKWSPDIAILSGDAMSMVAFRFIAACKEDVLGKVLGIFSNTGVEVCEGQMMDMGFERREDVTEEEYIRMVTLKTAVLIAASLEIGALCGGASLAQAKELYEYGRNLGIAFQLQDDYLDTYGDTSTFGKRVGNDILTNKKTFLIISALKHAGKDDHERLLELYSGTYGDPEAKVKEVTEIFDRCGVRDHILRETGRFFTRASARLDVVNILPERKKILKRFSEELLHRKA